MNTLILNTDVQEFITSNLNTNITSILLKRQVFPSIETKEIVEQIEAKKRSETKLSTWFNTKNIYYPNRLNIEQTSSEITAQYKSKLITGDSIIDITGGFGVDCYYFSKVFKRVIHCEINEDLSDIVTHNFNPLGVQNIQTLKTDGIEYLKNSRSQFDWVYIDPSRRNEAKGKVFFLKDCQPNVPENLDLIFNNCKNVLIKTSPLLDLSVGISELKQVKSIHIVSVNNEVKELLWVLEANYAGTVEIKTVNIKNNIDYCFNFNLNDEKASDAIYSEPLTYLYEPNASILKAGAFNIISKQLDVFKLHKHSHLYTSSKLIDFPGRIFKIEKILPYTKSEIKNLGIKKANITTRNFPETVETIRKKFKIQEGGDIYLFFTTDLNDQKIVLKTNKN